MQLIRNAQRKTTNAKKGYKKGEGRTQIFVSFFIISPLSESAHISSRLKFGRESSADFLPEMELSGKLLEYRHISWMYDNAKSLINNL